MKYLSNFINVGNAIFKYIFIVIITFIITSCYNTTINIEDNFTKFVGTKSTAPLEQTIWLHETGKEFDKLIWFCNEEMNLFYGLIENEEIQRWSDFYSAHYTLIDGVINVSLNYPNYGEIINTNNVSIISCAKEYEIDVDGERYYFIGTDASSFDLEQWIIILTEIAPWQ